MNRKACENWIKEHFHPEGLKCPHCQSSLAEASWFRKTPKSDLDVYRCQRCQGVYNLYSQTIFEGRHFTPEEVVVLIREVCQGKATAKIAREMRLSRTTVTEVRQLLQSNAEKAQPQTPLPDLEVETDEMFQNAGEKK